MNDHREPSPLLQAAMIHSQFEMIHPFEDGNGRVGRLIISLYDEIKKTLRRTDQYEIVDYLFNNLNLISTEFLKQTNLPKSAVYTTLRQLETAGYIVRTGSERKSRFVFQKLLDVI